MAFAKSPATLARQARLRTEKDTHTGLARIIFLAGLSPEDRTAVATPQEARETVALRKTSLMAGRVRRLLACTPTELDRWDADGRLPHLYVRDMPAPIYMAACRFWNQAQAEAALASVATWRAQDEAKKAQRRQEHPATTTA